MHTRRVIAVAALTVLVTALASDAHAVEVQGSLDLTTFRSENRRIVPEASSYFGEQPNGIIPPRDPGVRPERDLAIILTGTGELGASCGEYLVRGGDFDTKTFAARPGTTIQIKNRDACEHELFSETIDGFDAQQTASGNARPMVVPSSGHHSIQDRLYGHLEGHLHVVPDLIACGKIGGDGRYKFDDVAPGTYTLKILYEEREVHSQEVTVEDERTFSIEAIVPGRAPAAEAE